MTPLVRWKNFTLDNFKEVLGYYKDEYKGKTWKEVEDLIDSENKGYKRTSYQFCGQLSLEYKEGHKKNLFKIQDYLLKFSDEELEKYLKFWFMTYYAPNVRVVGDEEPYLIYLKLVDEILSQDTLRIKEEESVLFLNGSNDIIKNCFINLGMFVNFDKNNKEFFIKQEEKPSLIDLKKHIEKEFSIPEDYYSVKEFFERYSEENYQLFYKVETKIEVLEEEFKRWLKDIRNLADKTISNYINRSLPFISEKMKEFNLSEKDNIFLVRSFIEAQYLFESFFGILELKEADEKANRFYSSPFNNYIKFLKYLEESKDIEGDNVQKINFERNRIIYGAPGTGKSYLLGKETGKYFPDIITEKLIEELEEADENKRFWAVGAKWSSGDQLERFIEEGIWENGYSNKYLKKVKEIQEGDLIAIKASFTRKKADGNFISVLRTKALGIVKKNYNDGMKLDVEWMDTEVRDYDDISYRSTIHEVAERFLHIFNPVVQKNKITYTEKEEIAAVERVTFFDGYTYGQFVGSYKPVPKNGTITYEYVAGPFMRQLIEAYKSPGDNFCLIVEEINRARADKVFGNIFQLLDRDDTGKSQYPVSLSKEQLLYLQKELSEEYQDTLNFIMCEGLYIPGNLYIWATMNSADQGVYPLDTAFKRRWSFEHIGLNENKEEMNGLKVTPGKNLETEWNDFRKEINERLLSAKVSEDRLLAPFFVKKEEFKEGILEDKVFIDKILVYLFDDVLRHKKKEILFREGINNFSKLKESFSLGEEIFNENVYKKIRETTPLKLYSDGIDETYGTSEVAEADYNGEE